MRLLILLLAASTLQAQTPMQAFKEAFYGQMVTKLKTIPKGARIELQLSTGQSIECSYKGYQRYDDAVFVREDGKFFLQAYDISEIWAVRLVIKRAV